MSAILSPDDLNDFISPGVACIKPVETFPPDDASNPYEVTTEDKIQAQNPVPASISLTDCLACSGCVTSAEAVLVSLQSHTEVLHTLDAHLTIDVPEVSASVQHGRRPEVPAQAKLFVASVSPQVRASLAVTYGVSESEAGNMIAHFLSGSEGLRRGGQHGNGFTWVVDTNRMREACLVLGADEVGVALDHDKTPRPILTSACPGWICYAEKTHPHVLPHLSKLKSPQALTGTLLKSVLSRSLGIKPSQIWHLAIMPCFDKKLEASREELTDRWWQQDDSMDLDSSPVRDVDCVITSRELMSLAEARGIQFSTLLKTPLAQTDQLPFPNARISRFLFPKPRRRAGQPSQAGTSGGYLYHILKTQQTRHPGSTISVQRGRNADVTEYSLLSSTNTVLLRCARYYGFRNIQNLVRKLKPPKSSKIPGAAKRMTAKDGSGIEFAYVEVMACPGGCTNGGGQMKVEDVQHTLPQTRGEGVEPVNAQSQKEWLKRVDETYYSADSDEGEASDEEGPDIVINGISVRHVHDFLEHWADLVSVPLEKLAYTTFRKVDSDVGKRKNVDDSARIAAIAGMSGGGW